MGRENKEMERVEWQVQEEWMRLVYAQDVEGMQDMLNMNLPIDCGLPDVHTEIDDIPEFIEGATLIRWKTGDTALHFALRQQLRDSVRFLIKKGATKQGEIVWNEHEEDPRAVAQMVDELQDAAQVGDFEPLEPLLDPWERVIIVVSVLDEEEMSKHIIIDVRIWEADPQASTAYVGLEADTGETVHDKVSAGLPANWATQMLWWNGQEVTTDGILAELELEDECTIYLVRRPVPVNIVLENWTAENVEPLSSPNDPIEDTTFPMMVQLHMQWIHTEDIFEPFVATTFVQLHQEVFERHGIEQGNQHLEALYIETDHERMEKLNALSTKCKDADDTEGLDDVLTMIEALSEEIKGKHDILYEKLGEYDDRDAYVGELKSSAKFSDYHILEQQQILLVPQLVEPEPEEPEPEPEPEPELWYPPPIKLYANGDNAGAACVKVRDSETLELPRFEPVPVWSGEEIVAYGNLNSGKWEEDLAANPRDSYAMRRLGRSYLACDDSTKAIELFQQAIAVDPEYYYAKRDLAMAY